MESQHISLIIFVDHYMYSFMVDWMPKMANFVKMCALISLIHSSISNSLVIHLSISWLKLLEVKQCWLIFVLSHLCKFVHLKLGCSTSYHSDRGRWFRLVWGRGANNVEHSAVSLVTWNYWPTNINQFGLFLLLFVWTIIVEYIPDVSRWCCYLEQF